MSKLKVGVVGAGYLGTFHLRKYLEMPSDRISLVAVCDTNEEKKEELVNLVGRERVFDDFRKITDRVDAVSIAVPTEMHYEVARHFLTAGKHVLLEKPITKTPEQAQELNEIARNENLVFQIGHIERFNRAFQLAKKYINKPVFIECHRLSPLTMRSMDVDVVLDVMIHDLDIAMTLAGDKVDNVEAVGTSVLGGENVDIANVRITFGSGCIANITSSRMATKQMRKFRVFQKNGYFSIDFLTGDFELYAKKDAIDKLAADDETGCWEDAKGMPGVCVCKVPMDKGDALRDELDSFVRTIFDGQDPVVSGVDGERALRLAFDINNSMKKKNL